MVLVLMATGREGSLRKLPSAFAKLRKLRKIAGRDYKKNYEMRISTSEKPHLAFAAGG